MPRLERVISGETFACTKELKGWLIELKQRRESVLSPATKFLNNDAQEQLLHVFNEFIEIRNALAFEIKENQLDECNDGQISLETLKAIIEPDENKRRESMIKTIQKNTDRVGGSYYTKQP